MDTNGLGRRDRPCDACRKRKIRCKPIENTTTCALCQSRAEECTFVEPPVKKRPRQDLQSNSPDASSPDQRVNSAQAKTVQEHGQLPIYDYSNLPGPSLLKQTLGHQNRQTNTYIGAATDHDRYLINLSPFDSKDESISINGNGTIRRASYNAHFKLRTDTQAEAEQELATLDAIEAIVAPYGKALVDLYFRIVHPSFPIVHKKVFLEKHGRTYRELTPSALASVYILALNWWSYSRDLASLPKPSVEALEALIPSMLAAVYDRPRISDVQAGLVLLQRPEGDSWSLTGQLEAMAENLGLHLDCSDWRIPEWEKGVRKRVAWALFMQDKWGALIHGRPSHIKPDNWDVNPLNHDDFPETAKDDDDEEGSAEVDKGKLIFMNMVALSEMVADVVNKFFTLRAIKEKSSLMETLEKAKPIQIRLKDWHSQLPSSLSMDETKPMKLSSTGYLHLAYYTAEITLHRAILGAQDAPGTAKDLYMITRTAAKTRFTSAIDFVRRLKPEHLQSFWHFASKLNLAIIGTFGNMLWATSEDEDERKFYEKQLAEYRWTLRMSSKSAEFMKYTVRMLDSSSIFLKDLDIRIPVQDRSRDRRRSQRIENLPVHNRDGSLSEHASLQQVQYQQYHFYGSDDRSDHVSPGAGVEWRPLSSTEGPDMSTLSDEWFYEIPGLLNVEDRQSNSDNI